MTRKTTLHYFTAIITAACLCAPLLGQAAENDIPKRPPFPQYNTLIKHSPFAVASQVVVQQAPPFAKDLYLANAAKIPGGDMITVQSAVDRGMKEYLSTKGPNEHGYTVVSIDWSDRPAETKATISKDGQVATIGFNQALMSQSAAPSVGPVNPNPPMPVPGQPSLPAPGYVPPRMPLPATGTMPTPPPHTRGPIQRNPAARPGMQN